MAFRKINGTQLEQMLGNGLENLIMQEETINKLNVFPVPDGDTGTNMRKTLENGLLTATKSAEACVFLKGLSDGMLLGARGNSGVILSQFFRGFYTELSRCEYIGPGEMRNGLIRGYRMAYKAVVHPVEGTILSVAREGIEHIRGQITRSTSIDSILAMYVAEMKKTLAFTPDMLPVLKEADVVDSGAMGFIVIFEGMLQFLYGNVLQTGEARPAAAEPAEADTSLFHEYSSLDDGYCVEFLLQLMATDKYDRHFRLPQYISDLEIYGNSIVAVQTDTRVKVHIHTLHPEKVIALSRTFGEFVNFKLENMQVQHNRRDRKLQESTAKKPLAVIAVVNGAGMMELFSQFGCDKVIDGGSTMNTSSQEFIDAFASVNADHILVLPNHPNVFLAAQQAVSLTRAENVTLLNTRSFAEGYYALAMDMPDSDDVSYRIKQMQAGADNVVTLAQATASRDYTFHEIRCRKGDEILLINHDLACVSSDWKTAILDGVSLVENIDDRESCVVFRGADTSPEQEDELLDALSERYPLLDVEVFDAGQQTYRWIIGIS